MMKRISKWVWPALLVFACVFFLFIVWHGLGLFLGCGLFPLGPLLYLVFLLALSVFYILAIASVLTNKRLDGGSKTAWILVLLLLPLIGLLIWVFLGPRK